MRSAAKRYFLTQHPVCCFCGGQTKATTVDHQPSLSLFPEDRRPSGFWFPACESCNCYSRKAESKIPLILSPDPRSLKDHETFVNRVGAFAEHRPHVIEGMMMTNREKRNALRDRGLSLPEGVFLDDVPLMALPPTEWGDTFDRIAYKLALALHYRFTGAPLPPSGRVWSYTHSNTDIMAGRMPVMLLSMHRGGLPVDQQAMHETEGEFRLGGNFWPEIGVGAYVINIRDRLFFSAMSTYDASWVSPGPAREDLRPPLQPASTV